MAFTETNNYGNFSNTTPVEIVAAPQADTRHIIKNITIYNADVASVTVTISLYNSSTPYIIVKKTLTPTETLTIDSVLVLDETTDSIKGLLSDAATATQPQFTAHYAQVT